MWHVIDLEVQRLAFLLGSERETEKRREGNVSLAHTVRAGGPNLLSVAPSSHSPPPSGPATLSGSLPLGSSHIFCAAPHLQPLAYALPTAWETLPFFVGSRPHMFLYNSGVLSSRKPSLTPQSIPTRVECSSYRKPSLILPLSS